jgi:hypothetical protein
LKDLISLNKYIITSILTGALFFWNCTIYGQDRTIVPDSISQNTTHLLVNNDTIVTEKASSKSKFTEIDSNVKVISKDSVLKKDHSPSVAGIYSAIIPGLGQAYNHKYWKVPIIYVGGGAFLYFFNIQNNYYKDFKRKYEEAYYISKDPANDKDVEINGLNRDIARKNRDRLIFFTGLVYAANIIDAMVDAYFYNFDISDNLTLKVEPALNYPVLAMGNISYGFKLSLKF